MRRIKQKEQAKNCKLEHYIRSISIETPFLIRRSSLSSCLMVMKVVVRYQKRLTTNIFYRTFSQPFPMCDSAPSHNLGVGDHLSQLLDQLFLSVVEMKAQNA